MVRFSSIFFFQVHQETFGKSGCRRIVPGQYLAVDPKGRAILIGMFDSIFIKEVHKRIKNTRKTNKDK